MSSHDATGFESVHSYGTNHPHCQTSHTTRAAAMPGLLTNYDSPRRAASSSKRRNEPSIESQQSAMPRFTPMPTAYGLNEPQWSGYRGDPPPLVFARSPYARIPLPPMDTQTVLNPVLRPGGKVSIKWDITQHQSSAKLIPQPHQSSPFYLFQMMPALSPADTPSLTIRIGPFRTPIVLMAQCRSPGAVIPITVGDVLTAVYQGARRATSERTMQSANLDPGLLWSAIAGVGFEPAHGALGDPSMGAKDALSMNVTHDLDFRVHWFGLVPSRTEPDVWVLQTVETKPINHHNNAR